MLSLFEDNSFKKIQNVASVPQSSGERIRFQTAPCTVHFIFTLHKYLGFKYFKTILCIFILVTPSLQVAPHTFFINSRKYRNGAMLLLSFVFHTDNPSVFAFRANCLCCVLVCLKAPALTIFLNFSSPTFQLDYSALCLVTIHAHYSCYQSNHIWSPEFQLLCCKIVEPCPLICDIYLLSNSLYVH